jgi:fumarylacetoacetase
MTVNGASIRTGDLYASGTVSGPRHGQYGSLTELSWNGTRPPTLPDGTQRGFLEDGDVVTLTASGAGEDGARIGFGRCAGRVLPALP